MKRLRVFFLILIVTTLFAGLFWNARLSSSAIEHTEFLFDTTCSITVFSRSDKDAVLEAFDEAARIHSLSSFFDQISDVSKINKAKAGEMVTVDPCIIEMIDLANEIHKASYGAFDITLAPVSMLWKFDTENPIPPTDKQLADALKHAGKEQLALNKTFNTVTKAFDETKIDLGGIAKGYAADCAAEVLEANGVLSAIIDFGGNIITVGKNPKTSDGQWRIGLQKPFAPNGEYEKTLKMDAGAVATSGTYQRSFTHKGNLYHHIIDPKTGKPSIQTFSSVTVTSENSALADCLGTAIFVLGREKGLTLANQYGATVIFLK